MSEVCCDLCAYWLPQLKECGNTHINKCINKEHFVKVERNCGTCEREIRAKAIDEFAEKLNNSIDMLDLNYEYRCDGGVQHQTLNNMREIIQELSEQLKVGDNSE